MSRRAVSCTADEAVELIADGSTLACGGFVGAGHAEALTAVCIQRRQTSRWQNLLNNLRPDHARKS